MILQSVTDAGQIDLNAFIAFVLQIVRRGHANLFRRTISRRPLKRPGRRGVIAICDSSGTIGRRVIYAEREVVTANPSPTLSVAGTSRASSAVSCNMQVDFFRMV